MALPQRYDTTRVNFNLPTKLVEKLKAYSEQIGMPMTQTVTLLLNQSLESKVVLEELPKITTMYRDYKESQYNSNTDSLI